MYIKLKDLFNSKNLTTLEDANQLFEELYFDLLENKDITIDFKDIDILSTGFINHSIGELFNFFSKPELELHLDFVNTNELQKSKINLIFSNGNVRLSDDDLEKY